MDILFYSIPILVTYSQYYIMKYICSKYHHSQDGDITVRFHTCYLIAVSIGLFIHFDLIAIETLRHIVQFQFLYTMLILELR